MLSSILTPTYALLALLFGGIVFDNRTVSVQNINVPSSLTNQGYTSEVVRSHILVAALEVVRDASTRAEATQISLSQTDNAIELLAGYLGVASVLHVAQQAAGALEYTVGMEIVAGPNQELILQMRIRRYDGRFLRARLVRPANEIEALLRDAGHTIVTLTDPEISCSAILRRTARDGAPDHTRTLGCIDAAMGLAGEEDRIWLRNLQGVVLAAAGDNAGAVDSFRRSLAQQPDFSPSLVNLGLLFFRAGRYEEATQALNRVFRRRVRSDSNRTYAAAHIVLALSLERLGQEAQALDHLRQARDLEPSRPLATILLLDRLPPQSREAASLRHGIAQAQPARERAKGSQIYTDNLLGITDEATLRLWFQPVALRH